jgi:hypothetical protein
MKVSSSASVVRDLGEDRLAMSVRHCTVFSPTGRNYWSFPDLFASLIAFIARQRKKAGKNLMMDYYYYSLLLRT